MSGVVGLYVPGDRPERFDKAVAAGADQVIIDLEDAVAPTNKVAAREAVGSYLAAGQPAVPIALRINPLGSPWAADELELVRTVVAIAAVRIPKVQRASDIRAVKQEIGDEVPLIALIEDAIGLVNLPEIAAAGVAGLALGEADLKADLGMTSEAALDIVRVNLVLAARAAGLPAPHMAAFPRFSDDEALAASCRRGAEFGFGGRSAIHPRQVPIIRAAFTPGDDEIRWADEVLASVAAGGVAALANGEMVDEAMAARARRIRDRAGS